MILMFVSPMNSYFEPLMPNVLVLGGAAFGKWSLWEGRAFGHDRETLRNAMNSFVKETPEN